MLCRVHKDERIAEVIFIGLVTKEIALSELKNHTVQPTVRD
jgi:hypothetical protein